MNIASIFILAEDYDMEIHEVENIVSKYPETYYEELELFIKNRTYV